MSGEVPKGRLSDKCSRIKCSRISFLVEGTVRLKNQHRGGLHLPALLLVLQQGHQGTVRGETSHDTLNAGVLNRALIIGARVGRALDHGAIAAGGDATPVGDVARLGRTELAGPENTAGGLFPR